MTNADSPLILIFGHGEQFTVQLRPGAPLHQIINAMTYGQQFVTDLTNYVLDNYIPVPEPAPVAGTPVDVPTGKQ